MVAVVPGRSPNFERALTALRCEEPDRVPPAELWIDQEVRDAFLGRPVRTVEDEVAFWLAAGYDWVALDTDLWATPQIQGNIASPLLDTAGEYQDGRTERGWVHEEAGIIKTWEDVESFSWPKADDLDYSQYEEIEPFLPAGMKVMAYSATWVKKSIAGHGRATKQQVQRAVKQHFGLKKLPRPADVADALAIGVCCANEMSRAALGGL